MTKLKRKIHQPLPTIHSRLEFQQANDLYLRLRNFFPLELGKIDWSSCSRIDLNLNPVYCINKQCLQNVVYYANLHVLVFLILELYRKIDLEPPLPQSSKLSESNASAWCIPLFVEIAKSLKYELRIKIFSIHTNYSFKLGLDE